MARCLVHTVAQCLEVGGHDKVKRRDMALGIRPALTQGEYARHELRAAANTANANAGAAQVRNRLVFLCTGARARDDGPVETRAHIASNETVVRAATCDTRNKPLCQCHSHVDFLIRLVKR